MTRIVTRPVPPGAAFRLEGAGVHPLLARLYAARGVRSRAEVDYRLAGLLDPALLTGAAEAAAMLADAIRARRRLLIVADYDCDGATACAVGMRALRQMGAEVTYLVPNRFDYGYGLTPPIVELAARQKPDMIITVDNGIASLEGIEAARHAGIGTLITDHHLPGDELPRADVIVNPNQPGCRFPSKNLAGVGVMFYVMLALRAELRRRGSFAARPEPQLAQLLDLVALGTVADVVRLDYNNRILVAQGLARMRASQMQAGVRALFHIAGRDPVQAGAFDLGFTVGPRLNAAGRLADMGRGIEALITDDDARARNIAAELDALNRERRGMEADMQEQAAALLESIDPERDMGVTLFDPTWHQGVVGLLASRVKDRLHRPTIAFGRSGDGELKGSGRSIRGVHLRDVLDLVTKRHPGLILRFGGHAAAAGLTIREADLEPFRAAFAATVAEVLEPADAARTLETDGTLETGYLGLETLRMIEREVWGQAFPAPLFADEFAVENQRLVKERHLRLVLRRGSQRFEAIRFGHTDPAPALIRAVYRPAIDEYQGLARVQLLLDHIEPK
ncbi:MAG: single-stranded-DNA-specific exonuclease RecJ [Betaproteobacteria bacterium]|nr:single-stranded-DNA-specific exonuclease RecJ [Betaproteobacteria bacterium]